jgi:hypothetical protein
MKILDFSRPHFLLAILWLTAHYQPDLAECLDRLAEILPIYEIGVSDDLGF